MKHDRGITLISLVISILIMIFLAVVLIGSIRTNGVLEEKNKIVEDYEDSQSNTENKVTSIKEQWEGVI